MLRTIDPLIFLRESIQLNKKIIREDDNLIFEDGIQLSLSAPTALVQSQTKKQYTVGSLWLYLMHRSDKLNEYLSNSLKEGLDLVNSFDKEKINDFFLRDVDNIELIDNDLRPQTLIFLGKKKKGDPLLDEELDKRNSKQQKISQTESLNKHHDSHHFSVRRKTEDSDPALLIIDYIYSHEKKSLNRNSMLKPMNNFYSFESLLNFSKGIFTKNASTEKVNETLSFLDELTSVADDLRGNKAIIVVPSSFNEGNLSYDNAREFLENAKYINMRNCSEEERELCNHSSTHNHFTKKINDKELVIEICSNVRSFTKNEWKKVIGVFVQGDDWEFKDWPKSENVTSILQKVKGFYLKYRDLPINENVKKWNVKVLEISRTQRHFDVSIQNEFWKLIYEFLSQPRYR